MCLITLVHFGRDELYRDKGWTVLSGLFSDFAHEFVDIIKRFV
jgi:hypothetical protein